MSARAMARLLGLIGLMLLAACSAGSYARGVYHDPRVTYRIGDLPPGWRQLLVRDADLVFKHGEGGAILINAMCGSDHIDDVPLDVLVNQSLFGVEARQEQARMPLTLDGRAALRAQITGTLDGVPIALDMVVVKKDGCTFDFQLIAAPDEVEKRRPDFEQVYSGFTKLSAGQRP